MMVLAEKDSNQVMTTSAAEYIDHEQEDTRVKLSKHNSHAWRNTSSKKAKAIHHNQAGKCAVFLVKNRSLCHLLLLLPTTTKRTFTPTTTFCLRTIQPTNKTSSRRARRAMINRVQLGGKEWTRNVKGWQSKLLAYDSSKCKNIIAP